MSNAPKIPTAITDAISRLTRQHHELEDRREGITAEIAGLQQQWQEARTVNDLRKAADLGNRIDAAHSALTEAEQGLAVTRQALAREYQAAELARQPAESLSVTCPGGCGYEITPLRAWPSGKGYRSGEYDCLECDDQFSARWGGGIDPDVSIGR